LNFCLERILRIFTQRNNGQQNNFAFIGVVSTVQRDRNSNFLKKISDPSHWSKIFPPAGHTARVLQLSVQFNVNRVSFANTSANPEVARARVRLTGRSLADAEPVGNGGDGFLSNGLE
jgi:hypothetical protein